MPQLAPLEVEEPMVADITVQRNRSTRLAARNFRNIWYRQDATEFAKLKERVERAWPTVKLLPPELLKSQPPRLEMFFEENRITREIQWAGFGFQVWLQIHTHLLRGTSNSILVLDEPDIYLHPELQHRLYNDVREFFPQYFLATHATEIINEADSSEIVVIDRTGRSGRRIRNDKDYDAMLTYIGSAENADFAKISKVKKVAFVEGNDVRLLRRLAATANLTALASDQSSPVFKLGGFSQWKRAQHTVWAFRELLDVSIEVICIFDRDYRCAKEIDEFISDMKSSGIECFVLGRKEIENYLLVPSAIARSANAKIRTTHAGHRPVTEDDVQSYIDLECELHRTELSAQISTHVLKFEQQHGSSVDASTIISRSLTEFGKTWSHAEGRVSICPGKEVLSGVLRRITAAHGVSLSANAIASQLRVEEIDAELRAILSAVDSFIKPT